ncbi:MAG: hypothetical protein AABX83_01330 [Nanoarchaeota archaeon]
MQTITNQKNKEFIWTPISPENSYNNEEELYLEYEIDCEILSYTLNYTGTFYWNYFAIDNSSNKAFNNSNYTLIFSNVTINANYSLTYTSAGNLVSGLGKYYEYDSFNQLSRVRNKNASGNIIAEYKYDHNGQRIKQIEYNIDSAKNNRTTYYISDNFIQVRITNGTILNETYYYANGKLVAKKDNSGNKQFYHGDHLGSTSLVTNQSCS